MVNYFYDCYRILNKVYSDGAYVKQAIADTVIEEKNRALTVKTCYGVLDKDITLSYYLKALVDKSPKLTIRTILKLAMYDIVYLNKKEYAVIDNAVELVKKLGKGGTSGFVNAVLRRFVKIKDDIKFPTEKSEHLSVKYSYPEFAVKELIKVYGEERTEKIISAENLSTTLVFYGTDGEKYLMDKGIEYEKTPFVNVFNAKHFIRNADYDNGIYTYQALGSVAICDIVSPCDRLLDCCSAPGGKSIRLSYKCKEIVSFDIHEHRVALIEDYKRRMNRNNITAKVSDSKVFESEYENSFDAVLCDAPCSGLGVMNDNPDIKLNRTEESIEEIINEQNAILDNVSKYVKINGYLYYSTCSVLDRENIEVINGFLSRNPNYVIERIDSKLNHEDKNGTNAFLPDISGGLGFYVAKLKRIK